MKIREPMDVLEDVRTAIHSPVELPLSNLAIEFALSIDLCAPVPDELFAQCLSLLTEPLFRKHADAWEFLRLPEE